jgi:hypothetical protein
MEGYPISSSALDTVMNYLDTNRDGDVDLMYVFYYYYIYYYYYHYYSFVEISIQFEER